MVACALYILTTFEVTHGVSAVSTIVVDPYLTGSAKI